MTYGVLPTGFSRKPLAVILAEIEQQLITEFGPDVVQTSQSPLGQINGLFADMITELWELAEDVYQSYDPSQAEGNRLNILGNIRLLRRAADEQDASYRLAITNDNTARLGNADFLRALKSIDGVTYAAIFVNETGKDDENFMPPNSVAAAVIGGDDSEVAAVIYEYVIPGITMHGNTSADTNIDGLCRTIRYIRPLEIDTKLTIQVSIGSTRKGCPAPSPSAIAEAFLRYVTGADTRPLNGQPIDAYYVRQFIESTFDNARWVNNIGIRADRPEIEHFTTIPFNFFEIANVTDVIVEPV